jgi:hypothetical protein
MLKQIITESWIRAQSGLLGVFYVCCFWGKQCELDRLMQAYAVEKARLEARRQGHTITEQSLADGSVKLTVQVQGGAA